MNMLISASAGSGKTYALTSEFIRLLRSGANPAEIVASTFTRKAAAEILDRVVNRLAAACLQSAALAQLSDDIKDSQLSASDCALLLRTLCADLSGLSIGTLDSFFGRISRILGIGGKSTDANSPRCKAIRRDALRIMLGDIPSEEAESLLDALNTGKAKRSVLGDFDSLVGRLTESLGDAPADVWDKLLIPKRPADTDVSSAQTALATNQQALADKRWQKAVTSDLVKFSAGDWEGFVTGGIAPRCLEDAPTYFNKLVPMEMVDAYRVLLQVAQTELLGDLRRKTLAVRDLIRFFSEADRDLRRRENLTLFAEAPGILAPFLNDLGELTHKLDWQVRHLLLDEFQDTNVPQWGILRRFARAASQANGSVFVVGDAKQAIYGWRGGHAQIFEGLEAELPDMRREALDVSRRSSPVILECVNQVFSSLSNQPGLEKFTGARERWQRFFQPHTAYYNHAGYTAMHSIPPDIDSLPWSANQISQRLEELPPDVTAGVLVRKNETAAELTDLLRALGVNVSSEGAGAIADDPAVGLILSACMLADHPGHTAAAFHVGTSPLADVLGLPHNLHAEFAQADIASRLLRAQLLDYGFSGAFLRWALALAAFGPERTSRRLEQLLNFAGEMDQFPPMRPSEFVRAALDHKAENPEAAHVRVMTINKAKGLEFNVVFLPDLNWSAFGPPPVCLVRRADVNSPQPIESISRYPKECIRKLDKDLQASYEAYQDEEITTWLCLLYVSLTRARREMHMYIPATDMSKITPAKILRHALAKTDVPADENGPLYFAGDSHWYEQQI